MNSVEGALWLATQTPNIPSYSTQSNSRGIYARKCCNRCGNKWVKIISLCYIISPFKYILKNYSPHCQWLTVDIYLATVRPFPVFSVTFEKLLTFGSRPRAISGCFECNIGRTKSQRFHRKLRFMKICWTIINLF